MSFFQIVSAFRLYNADVLLLALGVTLLTSLLKNTVMKACNKKAFVVLPFGIGFIVFAVYRAIVTMSLAPIGADFTTTLEGGFGCGCAATLYYVIYEYFLRGKLTANPLLPLLEFVPEEKREEAAKALYASAKNLPKEEMAAFFMENLNAYAEPPMSEDELSATAEILSEFLVSLQKK